MGAKLGGKKWSESLVRYTYLCRDPYTYTHAYYIVYVYEWSGGTEKWKYVLMKNRLSRCQLTSPTSHGLSGSDNGPRWAFTVRFSRLIHECMYVRPETRDDRSARKRETGSVLPWCPWRWYAMLCLLIHSTAWAPMFQARGLSCYFELLYHRRYFLLHLITESIRS